MSRFPQMQPPPHQGFTGVPWPQHTPPQIIFNIGTGPQYHPALGLIPPQFQPSPHLKTGPTRSNDGLCNEGSKVPTDLSVEDEKALVHALRKWKDGGPTLRQVLRGLSEKNGLPERVWEKWFIANFETLYSKIEHASANSTRARSHIASRTRSRSRHWLSQSSTVTLTNERTHPIPRGEVESEPESDEEGSTYRDPGPGKSSGCNQPLQSYGRKNSQTAPICRSQSIQWPRPRTAVTNADLRAMALYRFEKGDNRELRRYRVAAWREFAQRPENYPRRTLDAWINIPRKPAHAAAINRYLEQYKRAARGAESANSRPMASPTCAGIRVHNATTSPSQSRVAHSEHADFADGRRDHLRMKRKKIIQDVYPDDIIDLTVEMEE